MSAADGPAGREMRTTHDEIRDGLFFIVGHHRGGTTLLQAMLTSHSRISIPPETQFFLEVWSRRARLGELSHAHGLRRALAFLESPDCSVRDLELDSGAIVGALAACGGKSPDYADLFVAVLAAWARLRGKPRIGEKSPGHIHCVPLLAELFPRARFMAVLRDPRAVVGSELGAPWGARSADQIASRWRRVVDRHDRLAARLPPERYTMVRYEDLVAHPERVLRELCAFLGEEFEPGMLRYHGRPPGERGFDPAEVWKSQTLEPLDAGRIDAWQAELSAAQIELVERAAGERLERLGYAPAAVDRVGTWRHVWRRLCDRFPWALEVATGAARRKRGCRRRRR